MQTVLPLTPGNPLRNVTGLSRQIALPGEHVPLRFPSYPALERTAVMGFNQPVSLELHANRTTALTVCRQACWPVWADRHTRWAQIVDYPFDKTSAGTLPVGASVFTTAKPYITDWAVDNRPPTMVAPGLNGIAYSMPFKYPLLGRDDGLHGAEWTYIPAGANWAFVVNLNTAPPANPTVRIDYDAWTAPGECNVGELDIVVAANKTGGMSAVGTVTVGTWVRPRTISYTYSANAIVGFVANVSVVAATGTGMSYTSSDATAGTVNLLGFETPSYVHIPLTQPAEFQNSQLPWFATRVTAAAMLGTNVSQVLNKGGTVLGGRMSPSTIHPWRITDADVSNLHPAEKAYLPLETGVYTYCPPSTDLVFFTDYTLNTGGGADPSPLYVLSNDSMYNKMFITASAVTEVLACTISWHLEFRTSSALFQVGLSAMTLESLHQAQLVLAESGFFFENPEHDKILNKVIATAKKFAPDVVSLVSPAAGKMLQSFVTKMTGQGKSQKKVVVPKSGPSKPATTSAKASGMMPSKKGKGKKGKRK